MSGMYYVGKATLGRFLCLCLLFAVALSAEECDKKQCKGPVRFYEDLKCKPIFTKPDDCCPVMYDCSHLNGRSTDKCYSNGHEYAIGETLKDEDRASPCDIGCACTRGYNDVATFTCAIVDCYNTMKQPKEGCYTKKQTNSCCGQEQVCPESLDEVAKCEVEGQTYMDGQSFYPKDNPELSCTCMEGYKGDNVKPFCRTISCGTELRRALELHENCAPVFYDSQVPRTSCSYAYRCQNSNDTLIPAASGKSSEEKSSEEKSDKSESKEVSADMMCKFGNITMRIGDELNQATDYSSVCVKCVCEVPPVPTCQRLPDSECSITDHMDFSKQT